MSDSKRIAVIVRDRPAEALRVAGGLTLADDTIDIFILDHKLNKADPGVAQPLELVTELELKVYSNEAENGYPLVSIEDMAKKLLEYDIVIPY